MFKFITSLLVILSYRPWYKDDNYIYYTCINIKNSNYNCIMNNVIHNKKNPLTVNLRGSQDKQIDFYFKNNSFDTELFIIKVNNTHNFTYVENLCNLFKVSCNLVTL